VGMKRLIAINGLVLILGISPGCGLGPRNFRKIQHPAPLVRARALSLGDQKSSSKVVPALILRLSDADPVVRLAAHEELKKRTGQDFDYVPWAEEPEREAAVARWKAWQSGRPPAGSPSPQQPTKALPAAPTQYRQTIQR
jgi:hypothetical protein